MKYRVKGKTFDHVVEASSPEEAARVRPGAGAWTRSAENPERVTVSAQGQPSCTFDVRWLDRTETEPGADGSPQTMEYPSVASVEKVKCEAEDP